MRRFPAVRFVAAVSTLSAIVFAVPSVALAADAEIITVPAPLTAAAPVSPATEARQKLDALVGTQGPAELAEIAASGKPAEFLIDDDGKVIAAFLKDQSYTTLAIGTRYGGCSFGDACAWVNGNAPIGFAGTGRADIDVHGITRIDAGSFLTTFFRGAEADFVAPGQSSNFLDPRDYNAITRR